MTYEEIIEMIVEQAGIIFGQTVSDRKKLEQLDDLIFVVSTEFEKRRLGVIK